MSKQTVYNGIDVINKYETIFKGKNIGLITNPTGVSKKLQSTIEILNDKYNLKALFSPEHGVRGDVQAGGKVEAYTDTRTGLPVFSLYGKTRQFTAEMLEGIDLVVMDIQDVGSRYYTYLYTMAYAMEGCAQFGIQFVLLDRVNPLGGETIDGNILNTKCRSFVGNYPIPVRYGLTMGELACLFNKEFSINCRLKVVRLEGWNRSLYFDETDLLWIGPSPNIPTLETAILYIGTCLLEGTNVSEGRGTTKPFEMLGAPWIDAYELNDAMNRKGFSGIIFRPAYFTPSFSKHQGQLCGGVQIHITNKKSIKAFEIGIQLIYTLMDLYKDNFAFLPPNQEGSFPFFDLLAGTDEIRLRSNDFQSMMDHFALDLQSFSELKNKYHLYD
ncbi:MAG TPA: DUF1343 domain-containing protein [Clostridiales bacterium]|nr:DUF1343 domain-containing protein [Clostridiales bacterium]